MWNGMHVEAKLFGNKGERWERGGVRKVRVGRDGGINSKSTAYLSDANLYNNKMNYQNIPCAFARQSWTGLVPVFYNEPNHLFTPFKIQLYYGVQEDF